MDTDNDKIIGTVSYVWTYEHFEQFSDIVLGNPRIAIWLKVIFSILGMGVSVLQILAGTPLDLITGIIFGLICFYILWVQLKRRSLMALTYSTNRLLVNQPVSITLYDDKILYETQYDRICLPFHLLYKVKGSNKGYVFMPSINSGIFIPKNICSQEIVDFIENIQY